MHEQVEESFVGKVEFKTVNDVLFTGIVCCFEKQVNHISLSSELDCVGGYLLCAFITNTYICKLRLKTEINLINIEFHHDY